MELDPREKVLLLGKELEVGTTDNKTLCFWCNGGQSKERSFAVTRVNTLTIKYICHRDKCKERGTVHTNGSGESTASKARFVPTPYTGKASDLGYEDLSYLAEKYDGIDLKNALQAGWLKADGDNSFLFPVWSPSGELRGHVLRRELSNGKKEVRSYKVRDEPWMCWYRTSHADVILVEDQISALKGASFATTVALLGAELSFEKMDEILSVARGNIWLALDKDAHKSTFEYLKKYRSYSNGRFNALLLRKDLKNMSYPDIKKTLEVCNV